MSVNVPVGFCTISLCLTMFTWHVGRTHVALVGMALLLSSQHLRVAVILLLAVRDIRCHWPWLRIDWWNCYRALPPPLAPCLLSWLLPKPLCQIALMTAVSTSLTQPPVTPSQRETLWCWPATTPRFSHPFCCRFCAVLQQLTVQGMFPVILRSVPGVTNFLLRHSNVFIHPLMMVFLPLINPFLTTVIPTTTF